MQEDALQEIELEKDALRQKEQELLQLEAKLRSANSSSHQLRKKEPETE